MRIGIDTFSLDRPGGNYGVGRGVYAQSLLPELFRLGSSHSFFVFGNRENEDLFYPAANSTIVRSRLPCRPRALRIWHEQVALFFHALRLKLDLVHFLGNEVSLLLGRRSLLTVYDFMWKYYLRAGDSSFKSRYFSLAVPLSLRRAGALLPISGFIAEETQREYPHTAGKVFPVLLGCPSEGGLGEATDPAWEKAYSFPFIFTITTSMPHKNLALLLEAFRRLKGRGRYADKLLVCGQLKGGYHSDTRRLIAQAGLEDEVRLLGFIGDPEKRFLLERARLFVFPSLYEGFGLPILEAMRAGVPVVAARAASLPEVGGNACRYFDPLSALELEEAMAAVLDDPAEALRLREAGRTQAGRFRWEETARQTLEVYDRLGRGRIGQVQEPRA